MHGSMAGCGLEAAVPGGGGGAWARVGAWTLTALTFPFRQLMAQEPLEKLGFGDLIGGKSDKN